MGKYSLIQKALEATADPAALVESFDLGVKSTNSKQVALLQPPERAWEQENKSSFPSAYKLSHRQARPHPRPCCPKRHSLNGLKSHNSLVFARLFSVLTHWAISPLALSVFWLWSFDVSVVFLPAIFDTVSPPRDWTPFSTQKWEIKKVVITSLSQGEIGKEHIRAICML